MKPADKLELARMFKSQGLVVAMAGDGINVTLRRWRAGREHRHGSRHRRVAIERAQVTLVKRDLRAIGDARGLSEASVRNMRQNLMFAFLYNALSIPLGLRARSCAVDDTCRPV